MIRRRPLSGTGLIEALLSDLRRRQSDSPERGAHAQLIFRARGCWGDPSSSPSAETVATKAQKSWSSRAEPEVRIHLPPARSPLRTGSNKSGAGAADPWGAHRGGVDPTRNRKFESISLQRRPDLGFEDLGEQQVKNIARPARVYRVSDVGGGHQIPSAPAMPTLPLPDKPSVAVLPFANMAHDPDQEF